MSRRVTALVVAVLTATVLVSFLIFTNWQARVLRRDALMFERLNATLYPLTAASPETQEEQLDLIERALGLITGEIRRLQIPIVMTDTMGVPSSWAHLPERIMELAGTPDFLGAARDYAETLDRARDHMEFKELNLQVHYGEPAILRELRWIPWLQAAALLAILGVGGWLLFTSFRSERDRIWSAMARESAHQMGTPLSSLVGWLEALETRERPAAAPGEPDIVDEMAEDVERLQKVSRRFELIGRRPGLDPVSVRDTVDQLRRYFRARLPSLGGTSPIEIAVEIDPDSPNVQGNATLLEWAFENLIKNAIDAMTPEGGRISIEYLGPNGRRLGYRVRDTGPGVPAKVRDKIFDIGVTTKESGWGVGLSLTRRIIEDVHGGSIQLEDTERGASFRVELPRVRA